MQDNVLQPINLDFEGNPVTAVKFRGRWCWLAAQIGVAIGYSQGERFASKFSGEWADEFIEGGDYAVLRASSLSEFRGLSDVLTKTVSASASKITVLYETGLHLALQKTRKQAGKLLRRALAENVLPQLVRDGRYDPERTVSVDGELKAANDERDRHIEFDLRRQELDNARRQLDISERRMRAGSLERLVAKFRERGRVGDELLETLEVKAVEIESGESLIALLPPADERADWETPTQIAERSDVSVQKVGRVITALSLRGDPELSWKYLNKADNSNRTVVCYRYAPEAVARIEQTFGIAA